MKKLLLLLFALLLCLSLTACGEEDEEEEVAFEGETISIKVYNWGEYISDGSLDTYDTNAEFEKYYEQWYLDTYGVKIRAKVIYSTYATNEDMYAKITGGTVTYNGGSGGVTYDVIIPSDYTIQKLAEGGWLEEINPAETIENYQYIQSEFKNLFYDPENLYSVPYSYGKVGIIYNTALVDEEDVENRSWDLLWNKKYRGKILQFNNPRDAFATAQYYRHIDVNSTNPDDWQAAFDLLLEQKPLVQSYVSDEIFNKMTTASAAIGTYYAGDYLTMVEDNEDLAFYYPTEGTNVFVDAMCIPKDAKRSAKVRQMALAYINFMLSEETAVANAEYIGYASPNELVIQSETYQEDMGEEAMEILYSEVDVNEAYPFDPFYHSFTNEIQTLVNEELWGSLKTESSTELWVHIAAIVPVVGALFFGCFTVVRKRRRSVHYRLRDKKAN